MANGVGVGIFAGLLLDCVLGGGKRIVSARPFGRVERNGKTVDENGVLDGVRENVASYPCGVCNFFPIGVGFCVDCVPAAYVWAIFYPDSIGAPLFAYPCGLVDFARLVGGGGRARSGGVFVLIPDVVRRHFGGAFGGG